MTTPLWQALVTTLEYVAEGIQVTLGKRHVALCIAPLEHEFLQEEDILSKGLKDFIFQRQEAICYVKSKTKQAILVKKIYVRLSMRLI